MKTKSLFVLFTLTISSCITSIKENDDKMINHINFSSANESRFSLVDSISYLPLVENEKALFYSISKLKITNKQIYLFDFLGTNSLLCFDLSGHFLFKVGQQGLGPGEYSRISDFDVNDSYIYLYDRAQKNMLIYDLKGDFVKSQKTSFRAEAFKLLNNGNFLFSLAKGSDRSLLVRTNSELIVDSEILKYQENAQDDLITSNLFQVYNNVIFYNKAVNDTIYTFSEDDARGLGVYVFDFGKQAVPNELKNNYEKLSSIRMNNRYIYFFDTPIIVGQILIGQIFKGKNKATLLYNLEKNSYSIKKWVLNKIDYNDITLPLFSNEKYIVGWIDYQIYNGFRKKPDFTSQQIKHMEEGGRILVFYHLNESIM